jgi:hypothetical protein
MRYAITTVLAALVVAGALLVVLRWEIVVGPAGTYRLDRWTGRVTECRPVMLSRHLDCSE